ncbi:MAG: hypothetical protein JWL98_1135 [Xanthomonadaceae bacterium]|nr:hypothetical protein [Xanthomonadaceae bacterium]
MERRIVSVGLGTYGWRVEMPERQPITIAEMQRAIVMACNLARVDHQISGQPTAVKVRMNCGDGVMIGFCG